MLILGVSIWSEMREIKLNEWNFRVLKERKMNEVSTIVTDLTQLKPWNFHYFQCISLRSDSQTFAWDCFLTTRRFGGLLHWKPPQKWSFSTKIKSSTSGLWLTFLITVVWPNLGQAMTQWCNCMGPHKMHARCHFGDVRRVTTQPTRIFEDLARINSTAVGF